jgi:serine/threonine protein kinase/tetratricopeptide (TPR) repeat protein
VDWHRGSIMIGARLAHYHIVSKLGQGGMGEVYLAEDTKLDRQIALKVLPPELAADPERLERFEREAKALAALDHPGIVTVFSVESAVPTDDASRSAIHFLTMQLVKGTPLGAQIPRGGMALERVVEIGKQLAEAIAAAHTEGIIHRDLKPANVMVSEDGRIRMLDFGLAKSHRVAAGTDATQLATEALTQEGMVMGTVPYMSPEQIQGGEADSRSDLFSLGILLHEMTTGARPFGGDTAIEQMWSIVKDTQPSIVEARPEAPHGLEMLIRWCLEKQPESRPQTALEVRDRLKNIQIDPGDETVTLAELSPTAPSPANGRRHWWLAAFLIIVLGAIGVGSRFFRQEPASQNMTSAETRESAPPLVANRVLVVPFENRTGDPSLDPVGMMAADWITQGLTQAGIGEVVSSLTALSSLRGTTGPNESLPTPHELAVDTAAGILVTGSYYLQGDNLLLSAEALNAQVGEVIGAIEPIRTTPAKALEGVEALRQRLMVIVASHLDARVQSYAETLQMPSYEGYRHYTRGMESFIQMDFPAAIDHYEQAAKLDPGWPMPLLSAAIARINLGQFAEAEALARQAALEQASLSRLDEIFLDRILATVEGRLLDTLLAARRGAEISTEGPFAFDAAALAVRANYPQEAIERFEALDPERGFLRGFAPYWLYLTEAYHVVGDHQAELAAARRARQLHPEQIEPQSFEIRALIGAGDHEEVEALLDASVALPTARTNPGEIMTEAASELLAHGAPEAGRQTAQRAVDWYRRQLGQGTQESRLRLGLAPALLLADETEQATTILRELVEENPESILSRGLLGIAAARLGDQQTVEEILSWFDRLERPYLFGSNLYWQAAIHAWSGQVQEALRVYQEALAAGLPFGWPRLHPHVDPWLQPLREDSDFQRLIAPRG